MKNSIFKKVASVIVATTILATSAFSALAVNNYTSESSNCSNEINWNVEKDKTGCSHNIVDGKLKSERTIFRGLDPNKQVSGTVNFTADGNGGWKVVTTNPEVPSSKFCLSNGTIDSGVMQAKFDVMFEGGAGQRINFMFDGYAGSGTQTGFQMRKSLVQLVSPNGQFGTSKQYGFTLEDNAWYTCTVSLDLDKEALTFAISKKDDESVSFSTGSMTIPHKGTTMKANGFLKADNGEEYEKGAVTGVVFRSDRTGDLTDSTSAAHPTSIWYVDNVEVDGYTETNYEINSIYRKDGIETNKAVDGATYKGLALTRLTRIADPANVSFITASYDEGRMTDVITTSLSQIDTTPVHASVTGNTVKSFIFDMTNAKPFVSAYQYNESVQTVQKIDYSNDYTLPNNDTGITQTIVDGALKIERSKFRKGSNNFLWDGQNWKDTGNDSLGTVFNTISFNKDVSSFDMSFKIKFAGTENGIGQQRATVYIMSKPVDITRDYAGNVSLKHNFGSDANNICKMNANEWYDINLKVTLNGTVNVAWTIEKDGQVIATANRALNGVTNATTTDSVAIYSRRDGDIIVDSTSDVAADKTKTTTSVWYIDDFTVKY